MCAQRATTGAIAPTTAVPGPPWASTAVGQVDWESLCRLAWHPVAIQLVEHAVRAAEPVSPRDMAEVLGLKLGDVGYHVRMLKERGVLVLVRTEQRRGAVKHFYEPAPWVRTK